MNNTAKAIQRILMALFGILNSLLPILTTAGVSVSHNFLLTVNVCSSVLLFLATKPLVEQQAEIIDGIKELVTIAHNPREPVEPVPPVPRNAEPFDNSEAVPDPRGERFNAYLAEDGTLEITPRGV